MGIVNEVITQHGLIFLFWRATLGKAFTFLLVFRCQASVSGSISDFFKTSYLTMGESVLVVFLAELNRILSIILVSLSNNLAKIIIICLGKASNVINYATSDGLLIK